MLINQHEQKGDRHLNKCRAFQVVLRCKKAKKVKMREEEVVVKSRSIQVPGSEVQWKHFCGNCKRIENRRTRFDRLRST